MFDIGWSELLILGIVTLLFVGPKDLPVFLRTVGRYFGAIKKQASEFRAQFDEALRETELDQLRRDVTSMKDEVESSVRDTVRKVEDDVAEVRRGVEDAAKPPPEPSSEKAEVASEEPDDRRIGLGTSLAPDSPELAGSADATSGDGATTTPATSPEKAGA